METKKKLKGLFWRSDFYGAHTEGGMASMHYGLLTGFRKLGQESIFVSSGRMSLPPDVKYYFIPYSKLYRNFPEVLNLPYNKKVVRDIKKIINIEKPDFIYQHHADFIYAGSILKKELGIPFLLQCEGVQQWVKVNWGKTYFRHLLVWAEEIQWQNADKIIVISENVKKMMIQYGVDGSKIIVNPSAVDSNVFYPEIDPSRVKDRYSLNNKFVVGFTGSFAQWHGVEVLAETIKYVTKSIPEAVFLLVGDGLLRPKIEDIIKKDNVTDKSIITGVVPYNTIPEHLAACDVLLSPCVHNKDTEFFNSPVKLFEYLAMGKPIVASDVGQQGEVIIHETNGLLCPEKDPVALADSIIRIYKDKDLAAKISRNARVDAVTKYDWTFNSQRIIDAYYEVLNQNVKKKILEGKI